MIPGLTLQKIKFLPPDDVNLNKINPGEQLMQVLCNVAFALGPRESIHHMCLGPR